MKLIEFRNDAFLVASKIENIKLDKTPDNKFSVTIYCANAYHTYYDTEEKARDFFNSIKSYLESL